MIKTMKFVWGVCAVWMLQGCEVTDPETVFVSDPTIKFSFINQRELTPLLVDLEIYQLVDSIASDSLDNVQSRLQILSDSLKKLQVGIDTGNLELDIYRKSVETTMNSDSINLLALTDTLQILQPLINGLLQKKNTIESGKVKLDTVLFLFSSRSVGFIDSLTNYAFPLNMSAESSVYLIEIAGIPYDLELLHENNIIVDARRRALVSFEQMDVGFNTFDSVRLSCPKCKANETTVICYF